MVSSGFFLNSHFGCNEISSNCGLRGLLLSFQIRSLKGFGIRRISACGGSRSCIIGSLLISCKFKVKYCKRKRLHKWQLNWIFLIRPMKGGLGLHMISRTSLYSLAKVPWIQTQVSVFLSWVFVWLPVCKELTSKVLHCYTSQAIISKWSTLNRLGGPSSASNPHHSHPSLPAAHRQQHRYQRTLGSWKLKTCEAQADPRQIDFEGPTAGSGLEKFQHVLNGCHTVILHKKWCWGAGTG